MLLQEDRVRENVHCLIAGINFDNRRYSDVVLFRRHISPSHNCSNSPTLTQVLADTRQVDDSLNVEL